MMLIHTYARGSGDMLPQKKILYVICVSLLACILMYLPLDVVVELSVICDCGIS